jgi:hypothetical protein
MHIHSIPKPPNQKIHNMGLSDLHEENITLFAMEYNYNNYPPYNDLEYYVNGLQHSSEEYDPVINDVCPMHLVTVK